MAVILHVVACSHQSQDWTFPNNEVNANRVLSSLFYQHPFKQMLSNTSVILVSWGRELFSFLRTYSSLVMLQRTFSWTHRNQSYL